MTPYPLRDPGSLLEIMASAITVLDVDASKFVRAYADYLKRSGKLDVPSWVDVVKTGKSKELAPYDPDWFYTRAASIARRLYTRPGTGVGSLRIVYGGRQNRGSRPSKHSKGSESVARRALQSLEKLNVVEKDPSGGRRLSAEGRRNLNHVAMLCAKTQL